MSLKEEGTMFIILNIVDNLKRSRLHAGSSGICFGTVSEVPADSGALVFCFTNLLLVDGHLMSEGLPSLTNKLFPTSRTWYNVE